ncbi:MAG: AI-2E family transporter [Rhodoferax sp.]|nr:AI-2E family transporter [Rhodoferax sp.]
MPQLPLIDDPLAAAPDAGIAVPAEPTEPAVPGRRNLPLLVLACLACLYTLQWARAVCIPLLVGMLFSYALSPVVDWLQQRGLPRALSAAMLVLGLVLGLGLAAYSVSEQASKLVELLPQAAQKLNQMVRATHGGGDNSFTSVQKAAARLEQAAADSTQATALSRGVQRVLVEKPRFDIKDYFWSGTLGLLETLGQAGVVALISFFLLTAGDRFRRKMVKLAGPGLQAKRVTLQALNQIHDQIQRYMLVQLLTSIMVGLATWLCFMALGLENAAAWGMAAGLLDLVPYVGSVLIAGTSALVAFLQFGTLEMALLVSGASLVIHSIESMLLTPWLASRSSRMNPVAIFVGVLAWGWLWGIWGLLLGVPVLVAIKAVCDRTEGLKALGELLGE